MAYSLWQKDEDECHGKWVNHHRELTHVPCPIRLRFLPHWYWYSLHSNPPWKQGPLQRPEAFQMTTCQRNYRGIRNARIGILIFHIYLASNLMMVRPIPFRFRAVCRCQPQAASVVSPTLSWDCQGQPSWESWDAHCWGNSSQEENAIPVIHLPRHQFQGQHQSLLISSFEATFIACDSHVNMSDWILTVFVDIPSTMQTNLRLKRILIDLMKAKKARELVWCPPNKANKKRIASDHLPSHQLHHLMKLKFLKLGPKLMWPGRLDVLALLPRSQTVKSVKTTGKKQWGTEKANQDNTIKMHRCLFGAMTKVPWCNEGSSSGKQVRKATRQWQEVVSVKIWYPHSQDLLPNSKANSQLNNTRQWQSFWAIFQASAISILWQKLQAMKPSRPCLPSNNTPWTISSPPNTAIQTTATLPTMSWPTTALNSNNNSPTAAPFPECCGRKSYPQHHEKWKIATPLCHG